jgi:hypothetical protein
LSPSGLELRPLDRSARSHSLFRLRYPGCTDIFIIVNTVLGQVSLSTDENVCTLPLSNTMKTQTQLEGMCERYLAISRAQLTVSKRHLGSTAFVMNVIPSMLPSFTAFL